jgi:hypothetical protein
MQNDVLNSMQIKYALTTPGLIPIQAVSNGIYGYHEEHMQLEKDASESRNRKATVRSLKNPKSLRVLGTLERRLGVRKFLGTVRAFRVLGNFGDFGSLCCGLLLFLLLLVVVVLMLLFLVVLALLLCGGFGHQLLKRHEIALFLGIALSLH